MPFFSNKNKKDSSDSSSERKNIITLACPDCGFEQTESRMAVSTYCRGCSTHYKITNGKAESNKSAPHNPFASLKDSGQSPKLRPINADSESSSNDQSNTKKDEVKKPPLPFNKPKPNTTSLIQKAAASTGLFQTQEKERNVRCFECEKMHSTSSEASSTLCPACGAYISLKNYEITTNWNRRIQTRGDVIIHKKATVTGITIHCHHLTTHGDFTGGVDCSGDFTIRSHGKIMGRVRCKRLIIEKKARVEFANTVHCEDAIIDGNVTGHFQCTGKLSLKKKATLTGDIKVATMAVEEGARHHGRMSIGQ